MVAGDRSDPRRMGASDHRLAPATARPVGKPSVPIRDYSVALHRVRVAMRGLQVSEPVKLNREMWNEFGISAQERQRLQTSSSSWACWPSMLWTRLS